MKKGLIVAGLLLALFLIVILIDYRFIPIHTVPGQVKQMSLSHVDDHTIGLLFEDKKNGTFGVAKIEKKLGFLYRYDGGTWGYWIEEGKPFRRSGIGDESHLLFAIKVAEDSQIAYVALSNHMEHITPSDNYQLSLEDVKLNKEDYDLKEVKDNYVLFVTESMDNNSIIAFDKDGRLIADQLYAGEARYIDWR